jgi:hypothetical protein
VNQNNLNLYQAAATVAHAMRQGSMPPPEALETLASNHKEAREALSQFGATRYARQLPDTGGVKSLIGRTVLLYKTPLPSEQQAKLSYEYLLNEFSDYLRRKVCAVAVSESPAHLAIWLPDGATLELENLWQSFVSEMTSATGLSKGFGLVMNSSKLSDRGFSTLETPMVSEAQPEATAAFYLANLKYVEQRIHRRQRTIERTKALILQENEEKKRISLEKQLTKDQDMQTKELEKYQSEFGKMFGRLLLEQVKLQKEATEMQKQIAEADTKARKKLEKQHDKLISQLSFDIETVEELQNVYQADAFGFMNVLAKHPNFASKWQNASTTARQYSETAANQLSTQKGDIYAKIIWETCVLLYGKIEISPLEPLLSLQPIHWGARLAGDNQADCCYSCGKPIEKDSGFRSRRLLFESPEQRTQSGGSSSAVQVCTTCAALSILSPVKFAPDTLVIRFNADERSVQDRVKQALEQQALNEIGASAGRYINITCTEKQSDGTLASQKLGMKQYAIAKLASLYPASVLRHLRPSLYSGGQEIPLRSSVLVAASVLMEVFQQGIRDSSDINMKLGEAIRLVENGEFVKASYVLARVRGFTQTRILEDGTKLYDDMLEKEEGMNKQARILADTHAMVGLLMPFCRQLLARTDLGMDETTKWREVGKLIQSIDENPTVFSYNTGKTVGGVGNLTRDYNTHFVFDKAKALIQELGDLPPYTDKDGETNDDPNKLRVTNDLIARAYEYILNKDIYHSDYDRKNFFYQVKLGLYARFPEAAKPKGDR